MFFSTKRLLQRYWIFVSFWL